MVKRVSIPIGSHVYVIDSLVAEEEGNAWYQGVKVLIRAKEMVYAGKGAIVIDEGNGVIPDYSTEVSSGNIKAGVRLRPNEKLKFFGISLSAHYPSIYPWIKPVLTAASSAHMTDVETGIDMPYTVVKGHNIVYLAGSMSSNHSVLGELYISYPPYPLSLVTSLFSPEAGMWYAQEIVGYEILSIDPLLSVAHEVDILCTNLGTIDVTGSGYLVFIEQILGSPPFPDTKIVQCPFCNVQKQVPQGETLIRCDNCGKGFVVRHHPQGGRIR